MSENDKKPHSGENQFQSSAVEMEGAGHGGLT